MKVFADLHHDALFYSLQLLFEKRFGAELYRPIGLEWYENKFWDVWNHPDTAKQYLGLDQAINIPKDVHGNPLPESARLNASYRFEDGIYYVNDPVRGKVQRAITLDKFKAMEFDILLCSMPQHIAPFLELQKQFQPKAKLIFQAGNAWMPDPRIKNFMGSIAPVPVPSGVNAIFYHQEFDLDIYKYEPPQNSNKIFSFVHYMKGKEQMNRLAHMLPGWELKSFGAGMEDSIMRTQDVAAKMREAAFVYHKKPGGDGFGHTIFGAYASGRPAIIWGSEYRGKLADKLFEHDITCIDAEKMGSIDALAAKLKQIASTDKHVKMCEAARARFDSAVNYESEFERMKSFIQNLV